MITVLLLVGIGLFVDLVHGIYTGRIPFSTVSTFFWDGILTGLILGLAGVGLSMTYSILNFANFSHGDLVTAGAFSGWAITYVVAGFGIAEFGSLVLVRADGGALPGTLGINVAGTPVAIVLGLLGAVVFTILVALVIDRLVYRRMREDSGISLLIASIGVALALRYAIAFVFGARSRGVTANVPSIDVLPFATDFGVVDAHKLTLMFGAIVLMLGVHLLIQRTKLGTAMRAMADNKDLALITGIPTERVVLWTWIVGAGLTGAAGYLIVLQRGAMDYNLGWGLLLLIFAAVILGGIGSIYGAIGGGLIIGLASTLSIIWIPADFAVAAAFLLMILVLVFKPAGLFSGVTTA